jgi:hypothetical protein
MTNIIHCTIQTAPVRLGCQFIPVDLELHQLGLHANQQPSEIRLHCSRRLINTKGIQRHHIEISLNTLKREDLYTRSSDL